MKNKTNLMVVLLAAISLLAIGCAESKYEAVSGKVTANGEPVPNVRLVFTPMVVGENHNPGPYSMGLTNEDGIFKLKTRYDEPGAVAGPHKVGFEWADVDFDSMSTLNEELGEVQGDAAKMAAVQRSIDELKQKLESRPKVDFRTVIEIEIPQGGTDSADFEIGK
ncbi:MAG: hypothetical protein ACI87E_001671 [Mariniblastus sp.]|jgi:hypothetical protein